MLSNGTCISCNVTNCSQCSTQGVCSECLPGHNLTMVNGSTVCVGVGCPANCSTAGCNLTTGVCSECEVNFTLNSANNTCISCADDPTCSSNTTNTTNTTNSTNTTNETGLSCSGGVVPNYEYTQCVVCNAANCLFCSSVNQCVVCNAGYIASAGKCLQCSISDCLTCGQDGVCSECAPNYYLTNNTCLLCLAPCRTCNPDGTCLTCINSYSQIQLAAGQSCFFCSVDHCVECSHDNSSFCNLCAS